MIDRQPSAQRRPVRSFPSARSQLKTSTYIVPCFLFVEVSLTTHTLTRGKQSQQCGLISAHRSQLAPELPVDAQRVKLKHIHCFLKKFCSDEFRSSIDILQFSLDTCKWIAFVVKTAVDLKLFRKFKPWWKNILHPVNVLCHLSRISCLHPFMCFSWQINKNHCQLENCTDWLALLSKSPTPKRSDWFG